MSKTDGAQFTGTVKSCIFKGVHYEMFVETSNGYELMVQDYNCFEVGSLVGLYIKPSDIQVMRKERTCNTLEATLVDETHIDMLGARWECLPQEGFKAGDSVKVTVDFDKVDLLDHQEDGQIAGEVRFLLYKGNHYHLTIDIDGGGRLWVDTDDIWDKGDLVGVNIRPQDLNISRCDG